MTEWHDMIFRDLAKGMRERPAPCCDPHPYIIGLASGLLRRAMWRLLIQP